MDPKIMQVLLLLFAALFLFASEIFAVDVVAVCLLLILISLDLLDISEARAGFGHPAVVGQHFFLYELSIRHVDALL